MKVTAILKGKKDQNGQYPVTIRIADGPIRIYRTTKIRVSDKQFKKGRIKDHPQARELNREIEGMIIRLQGEALNGFQKKHKTDFYAFVERTIPHLTLQPGTLRQHETQINKLKKYKKEILLSDFSHDWFNDYHAYLKDLGNDENTRWGSFKFLKKFIRIAKDQDLISKNPFDGYKFAPKYRNPEVNYLTAEEVQKIEDFIKSPSCTPALFETGVWFLIGCYTGLRISDIKAFTKEKNIVNNRLIMRTQKTKEMVSIPIIERLRKYFEMVNYQTLSVHPNTYNDYLKIIAGAAGVNKRLHAHLSRHTAAMLLANSGVPPEVVAKILGHSSIKTVMIYYKISGQRLDTDYLKIDK